MSDIFRYNWHETNIAEFLQKYHLPVFCDETDIACFIEKFRDRFLGDYDSLIRDGAIKGFSDDTYKSVCEQKNYNLVTFDQIIAAIRACQDSRYADAENIVNEIMANAEKDLLITSINGIERWNPKLFRIRVIKGKSEEEVCSKDLLHIPYGSRHLARNERFSITGQPCLYLSTALNIAWKECGMPSSFFYSKYVYDYKKDEVDPWHFLVLAKPQLYRDALCACTETDRLDFICRYLRTYPIVMACSIICNHQGAPYKPEYVFPQLLMQWIHRNNDTIRGVIYYSCIHDTSLKRFNGFNIAIPAVDPNEEGYSRPILERFDLTNPVKRTNAFSKEQKEAIESFYNNEITKYSCKQNELSDCLYDIYDISQAIYVLSLKAEHIDSDVLIMFVDSINKRIETFFRTYKKEELIIACRNAESFQERYEADLSAFTSMFENFRKIGEIIEKYSLHIEHGLA